MSSSISTCINALGTSNAATFLFCHASTTAVRNTALVEMVGDADSFFVIYACCLHPLAQPRPLILPHRFFFKNIKYPNTSFFCSGDKSFWRMGCITFRSCNCCISFFTAAYPPSPNNFNPFFIDICGVSPGALSTVVNTTSPLSDCLSYAPSHIALGHTCVHMIGYGSSEGCIAVSPCTPFSSPLS